MIVLKKQVITLFTLFLIFGCASKKKNGTSYANQDQLLHKKFEKGLKYLDESKYSKAARIFNKLLVQKPTSNIDIIILFNSAIAYEGLKKCKTAARRFRQVIDASQQGRLPRVEAQALVRLSYVYECLGKDTHVITSLLDAKRRSKHLAPTVVKAELPARLAAAYLRLGNRKKSEMYFAQAENGIRSLRFSREDPVKVKDVLASTLFLMGRLDYNDKNKISLNVFVENLRELQKYLLKSVEMGHKNWSPKAARQIVDAYKYIWEQVRRQAVGNDSDRELARKKVVQMQKKVLLGSTNNIEELRNMRFPDAIRSRDVVWLFDKLEVYKKKYLTLVSGLSERNTLTPNARSRQNLFKPHMQKSKNTVLENMEKTK